MVLTAGDKVPIALREGGTTMSPRRHRFWVIMSVVALTMTGCSSGVPGVLDVAPTNTPVPAPTPSGDGVLRVGTEFPTSGTFAFLGPAPAAGVALAVADINAAGGVLGVPVEIIARDSGEAGTTKAETSFGELTDAGADVVVGPMSSVLAQRLAPLARAATTPLISPAATFPALSDLADGGFLARTVPDYAHQGYALAQAISAQGPKTVGFLYIDDDLGRALFDVLPFALQSDGSELVVAVAINPADAKIDDAVAQVKEAGPDVVVIASAYSTLDLTKSLITKTIAAGFGGARLWLTTQNTGDYSQTFPNGTLTAVNGIVEGIEADDALKARLKAINSGLGSYRYAAEAYDATIIAALAAVIAGDDGGASLGHYLQDASGGGIKCTSFTECLLVHNAGDDLDYDGISGPLDLDSHGDVRVASYGIYAYDGESRFQFKQSIFAG